MEIFDITVLDILFNDYKYLPAKTLEAVGLSPLAVQSGIGS